MTDFSQTGYFKVPNIISEAECKELVRHVACTSHVADTQVINSSCMFNSYLSIKVLDKLHPIMENIVQKKLDPTYTCIRVYRTGCELKKHIDKEHCEYSISINLKSDIVWPLWFDGVPIELNTGDGLIYLGHKPHWREPLSSGSCVQMFLHYVDKNGPYRSYKFNENGWFGS